MNIQKFKEDNPHLSHLAGKSMSELQKMFPDAKHCDSKTCDFNDIDHAIFMEYEQEKIDAQKQGKIRVMYHMNEGKPDTKIFYWHNGKKWIELRNTKEDEGKVK